ncbi:MAG: hypothetical protein GF375_01105 [Candidatus Omnitrophica bacterium]|nr:hypothetical protein [Candidatus Omnitrophota bacterium]MBD3268734.1 hypothetical protein [Candidatus Omnitrophota bacterium]
MLVKIINIWGLSLFFIFLLSDVSWSWGQKKDIDSKNVKPKTVQVDKDYDGRIDRIEKYDSRGAIISIEADTTGDGKINEWVYYEDGLPRKAEKDIDGDGKTDTNIVYDKNGVIVSSESDTTDDGKIDEWVYYEDGKISRAEKDTNGDGKADTWLEY